jgi:hypothetical protein
MALDIGNKVENNGLTANGKLTAAEFNQLVNQINLNTPIEVESEEALETMIAQNQIVEGQIYFIAEES